MLDEVAVLRRRTETAFASASLTRIRRDRRALDVAAVRDGDRNVFVGNQIFNRELDAFIDNLRTTLVTKVFPDLFELLANHAAQRTFVAQNLFELRNQLDDAFVLIDDLLPFESRQPAQLQIENRLRLDLRKREAFH